MKLEVAERKLAFDASTYVDPKFHKLLLDAGYNLAIRYLRRDKHVNDTPDLDGGSVSLSKQELAELTAAGFQVSFVQFASLSLVPSRATGLSAGEAAAWNASTLGVLPKATLWCDLEWSTPPSVGAQSIMDYCNAWAEKAVAAGFDAGLYVGPNSVLTADQLYSLPKYNHYWKSAAAVPWVSNRGYQMFQGMEMTVFKEVDGGLEIDQDLVVLDNKYNGAMNGRFYAMAA